MPLPKPKKDETKKEFIDRCMADPVMNKEFPQSQRYAVCKDLYYNKNKS